MGVVIAWGREPDPEPAYSKLEDALSRGYNPTPDDLLPPAQHLSAPAGVNPLAWFIRETRGLRIVGPLTRCANHFCRTTVTEDAVSFCPHNLPFCEGCAWEGGGCDDCANGQPNDHEEGA